MDDQREVRRDNWMGGEREVGYKDILMRDWKGTKPQVVKERS